MELFAKIVNDWKSLSIFAKTSILGVWLSYEETSEVDTEVPLKSLVQNIQNYQNE